MRDGGALYAHLGRLGSRLRTELQRVFDDAGVPAAVQGRGSMMQVYFIDRPSVRSYREAPGADAARFSRFAHSMLNRGVFVHPDQFEHWFLSKAHTDSEIDRI